MGTSPSTTQPHVIRHFTSSILLWVRTDQSRQTGMDCWKGPHSGIIAATPGLSEYRQIHLAEHNPACGPPPPGRRPLSRMTGRSTASRKSPSNPPLSPWGSPTERPATPSG